MSSQQINPKTELIREAAQIAAAKMALAGDPSVLEAASEWADSVRGLSIDGALEAFALATLHAMRYNGHCKRIVRIERAIYKMDVETRAKREA